MRYSLRSSNLYNSSVFRHACLNTAPFTKRSLGKNPLKSYDCFFYQLKSSHHRGMNVCLSFEAPDPFGSFFLVSAIML